MSSSCGSCRRLREGVVDDGVYEVLDIVEGVVGGDVRELRLEVLVVCKVADRPALLRAVARQHAERRQERRGDALEVQLRVLRHVRGSLMCCSLNNVDHPRTAS